MNTNHDNDYKPKFNASNRLTFRRMMSKCINNRYKSNIYTEKVADLCYRRVDSWILVEKGWSDEDWYLIDRFYQWFHAHY